MLLRLKRSPAGSVRAGSGGGNDEVHGLVTPEKTVALIDEILRKEEEIHAKQYA